MGEVSHPDAVKMGSSWRCPHCGLFTNTKPLGEKSLLPCAKCDSRVGWGETEVSVSLSCNKYCWSVVHFFEDEVSENIEECLALVRFWNELQRTYPRFQELKATWLEETKVSSSGTDIISHSAYREIISLGDVAVALILDDLRTHGPNHWFAALTELTGADPVSKEHAGSLEEMALDWFHWAEEKLYEKATYDKPTIDFTS
jgi:hypothetical protein